MYHLPLLPGYSPNTNIRSSALSKPSDAKSLLFRLSEAEETGYQGTYFASQPQQSPTSARDGYVPSSSPTDTRSPRHAHFESDAETDLEPEVKLRSSKPKPLNPADKVAEVVFFQYGVIVFFGLDQGQEMDILEDIGRAGILKRPILEDDWEVEECHFAVCTSFSLSHFIPQTAIFLQHDPNIAYPRIYNDFFSE
jgi:uncharacterized Rmd1/YagE family protein